MNHRGMLRLPLHLAAEQGDVESCEWLLGNSDAACELRLQVSGSRTTYFLLKQLDAQGRSALEIALFHCTESSWMSVSETLASALTSHTSFVLFDVLFKLASCRNPHVPFESRLDPAIRMLFRVSSRHSGFNVRSMHSAVLNIILELFENLNPEFRCSLLVDLCETHEMFKHTCEDFVERCLSSSHPKVRGDWRKNYLLFYEMGWVKPNARTLYHALNIHTSNPSLFPKSYLIDVARRMESVCQPGLRPLSHSERMEVWYRLLDLDCERLVKCALRCPELDLEGLILKLAVSRSFCIDRVITPTEAELYVGILPNLSTDVVTNLFRRCGPSHAPDLLARCVSLLRHANPLSLYEPRMQTGALECLLSMVWDSDRGDVHALHTSSSDSRVANFIRLRHVLGVNLGNLYRWVLPRRASFNILAFLWDGNPERDSTSEDRMEREARSGGSPAGVTPGLS